MVRIVLVLILVGIVLAFNFLPWWGLLIGIALLSGTLILFRGKLLEYLFTLPFRAKGKALHKALAEVHEVRPVAAPLPAQNSGEDEDEGEDDSGPREHYQITVTITPQSNESAFGAWWEPSELRLLAPQANPFDDSDDLCRVSNFRVLDYPTPKPVVAGGHEDSEDEEEVEDDDGLKVNGPHRISLNAAIKPGTKRLVFVYYFEKFGEVVFA